MLTFEKGMDFVMRRERSSYKFAIIIIAVVIFLLIGVLILKGIKSSKQNEFAGQMSKLSEDLSNSDTVSTKIGKTVEQAKNEIEEQQGFEVPTINEEKKEDNKNAKSTKKEKKTNNSNSQKNESSKKNETIETNAKNTVLDTNLNKENIEVQTNSTNKDNNSVETNSKNIEKKEDRIELEAPIKGEIIREFAKDSLVFSNTLQEWVSHNGVDIKADKTSVVKAAAKGTVAATKNDPRYGLTVIINHDNGYQTVYSNLLTAEFVVKGEKVDIGQSIGTVGNSASFEIEDEYHLHFELLKDSEYLNPTQYMNF